jgi:hypothetical protein
MAHYAFLDENNRVVEVIVGRDENEEVNGITNWEQHYQTTRGLVCKRTSFNTFENQHRAGGTPFRGNYAAYGMIYDEANDVFYNEQPYPSWSLDNTTWTWQPPIPRPSGPELYIWDEPNQAWNLIG